MRVGSLVAICIAAMVGVAHADAKGDVAAKIKQAMESYDMMDYDAARKLLNQALASAKKAKLDKDQLVAKAYLDLGIIAFQQPDVDAAKLSFLSAVQIDPKIQIDPAYRTAEMAKLLDQARTEATGSGGSSGGGGGGDGEVSCTGFKGLDHQVVETAKAGIALPIEARLGPEVKAEKVVLMYRAEGATDFTEVRMQKSDGCKYSGLIPAGGMKGNVVHYYVAAMNEKGKPVAAKGSAGSPNIMELTAAPAGGNVAKDDEDPINGHKAAPKRTAEASPVVVATPPAADVTSGGGAMVASTKSPKVMIAVLGGSGFGYLSTSYMTEALNPVHSAGFSNPNAVVMPELGFYVMPQLTISAVARLEVPVGANVEGHATLGPAGLLRVRYALKPTGEGLRLMLQGGFGIMRSTIKLDNNAPGMDTDVVAQGPLLLGGGAGYWHKVSGSASFVVEMSVIDGIATQSHLGTAPHLNGGLDADLSLGIALGF